MNTKQFITEVEVADENGNAEVREVVTEMTEEECARAEALHRQSGGYLSHNEIVALATSS